MIQSLSDKISQLEEQVPRECRCLRDSESILKTVVYQGWIPRAQPPFETQMIKKDMYGGKLWF